MSNIVALIGARAGSKGVPNKNIKPLSGHSLLAWSIAACLRSLSIDRVIVSTDSADYATLATKLGAEAQFLRPEEISGDRSTDSDFILHALNWLADAGEEPEHIVHIRPTTPLRDPAVIDAAVQAFRASSKATALRSVHEMSESAYKTFELTEGGQLKRLGADNSELDSANNARQQFPITYQANGYVDILSSAFIRKSGGLIHGDHVIPFITPSVIEVDTLDDFYHLEFQISRMPGILQKLFI
jgi:CMP-N,N'-diacetyllegionaminic acid synthase